MINFGQKNYCWNKFCQNKYNGQQRFCQYEYSEPLPEWMMDDLEDYCEGRKPVTVKVWRDGEVAKARMVTGDRDGEITSENIGGSREMMLQLKGCLFSYLLFYCLTLQMLS